MTKRQLKKIKNMYHEGISLVICIASIIELSKDKTSTEVAELILDLQKELFEPLKLKQVGDKK